MAGAAVEQSRIISIRRIGEIPVRVDVQSGYACVLAEDEGVVQPVLELIADAPLLLYRVVEIRIACEDVGDFAGKWIVVIGRGSPGLRARILSENGQLRVFVRLPGKGGAI
ncbi:hypothetical protein T190_20290 [Sinorhizobium meliloti CCBAU 01290]|nr:hypothetical protein T190_20290 [Sinorhizobium meliloti CCBAU 01290]